MSVSASEQSSLIKLIATEGGFVHESFISASGIESNFKIELAEIMDRNIILRRKIAGYIVGELEQYRVNMILSTGGAIPLARDVAAITDMDFLAIDSSMENGVKTFRIDDDSKMHANKYRTRLAYVEDVSSTWGTVRRSIGQSGIRDPEVAISAWRRGIQAPVGMTGARLVYANSLNNRRPPYEEALGYVVKGVIERPMPLVIEQDDGLYKLLPELLEVDTSNETGL